MNLKSGEIYFIGERDPRLGTMTSYFKIGIVKEGAKGPRTSNERLLEHQTGNPRELVLHTVITTPAVEEIETRLHLIYAPQRVFGEWLELDPNLLEEAVSLANSMKNTAELHFESLLNAERLKKELSNDEISEPDTEALTWFEKYHKAKAVSKACDPIVKQFKSLMKEAVAQGEDVEHITHVQVRKGQEVFDLETFMAEHPKKYGKFLVTVVRFKQRFLPSKWKGDELNLADINPDLQVKLLKFQTLAELVKSGEKTNEILHGSYLEILAAKSLADWDSSIAESMIRSLCGTAAELRDVCKWSRSNIEEEEFDISAFAEAHPKLYAKYLVTSPDIEATIVEPRIKYATS